MLQRKQVSRKFIDLIKTATSKWVNWDPAVPIQVSPSHYLRRREFNPESDSGRRLWHYRQRVRGVHS